MRAIQKSKIGRPYDYYYSHDSVDLLYRLNVRELSVLKWLGSILFAFGHLCLGLWLLKTLRLKFGKWLVQGYVLLFGSAAVAYIVGVILGVDFYLLARRIVGFLQSPLPVIVPPGRVEPSLEKSLWGLMTFSPVANSECDKYVKPAGLKNIVLASSATAALPAKARPKPVTLCSMMAKPAP